MFKWFLSRTLYHINGGSVLKTIQREWRTYKNRRRQNWWDSQSSKRISLIFNLQKNIRIYLHFDSKLSQLIYFNDFEKAERVFVNKVLKPGDTFVDVGANIGLFSLIAANCVGKKGRVVAFEPVEKIYQRFCDNIKLNDFLRSFKRLSKSESCDDGCPFILLLMYGTTLLLRKLISVFLDDSSVHRLLLIL